MNFVASAAWLAISAVDQILNRAMALAWTATLNRQHPAGEDDDGGGNIFSREYIGFENEDQPLQ